jgi:hypothetical protein
MKLLTNKWLIRILSLLGVAGIVNVLGPLFAFGAFRPLGTLTGQIIFVLLIVVGWLGMHILKAQKAGKAEKKLVAEMVAPPLVPEGPDASQEERAKIQKRFEEAMAVLKKSRGRKGKLNLYDLPWYILIAYSTRSRRGGDVPDRRTHRGPHPGDSEIFGAEALAPLRGAAGDLSWLLSRGYARASALKLVGDRYQLHARQRLAVARAACSDLTVARRVPGCVRLERLGGLQVYLDGFNLLTTVEAALSGAFVLACRDGTYRDIAGIHGGYRAVEETVPAIRLVGDVLAGAGAGDCMWVLDRPVSNSGRLRSAILAEAAARGWAWSVELADNADELLVRSGACVATADSGILDRVGTWANLAREVVDRSIRDARVVYLFAASESA